MNAEKSKPMFSSGYQFIKELSRLDERFASLPAPDPELSLKSAWLLATTTLKMDPWALATLIAQDKQIRVATDLDKPESSLLTALPNGFANRMSALPLYVEDHQVVVATANPFDPGTEQLLRFVYGAHVRLDICPADQLEIAIARAYSTLAANPLQTQKLQQQVALEEKEIPRLSRQLMEKAVSVKASDMHIQPFVGGYAVRLRVDGMLRRILILPEQVGESLVRHIKARAGMDSTNQMIPQDGSASAVFHDQEYDLRISSLPVAGGNEKLVVRFLTSAKNYSLATTGLSLLEIQTLRRMASAPAGVVLLCGPTGSGKTTTLYSILAELNHESVSITTVEDPVEYRMQGLSQTAVNVDAGLTFAKALRAILRQDPDVILIGEIRDGETAQIAMQSAMTGHLVFSTLHTNDAIGAIPRLLDLEILPAILSQALTGIVSQRLLRKLCTHCRQAPGATLNSDESAFASVTAVHPPYRAVGCEKCGFTGYSGRVVITEMIEITTALAQAIAKGEKDPVVLKSLAHGNIRSLAGGASRRIISGESTAAEAARVIGRQFWWDLAAEYNAKVPELADIQNTRDELARSAILLVGENSAFGESFEAALREAWYTVMHADSPDAAKHMLEQNNQIELVVVDVPHRDTEDEVLHYVADYRTAMAWSRLPALLLLHDDSPERRQHLRDHGATSQMLGRDTPPDQVVRLINKALSRHVDFRWKSNDA